MHRCTGDAGARSWLKVHGRAGQLPVRGSRHFLSGVCGEVACVAEVGQVVEVVFVECGRLIWI